MTEAGKYKLLPRYVARKHAGADLADQASGKADGEYVRDYSDWIVKRCNLIGLGLPFFVGYSGKLCLLNPEALALYEAGEIMVETEDGTLFNPNKVRGKMREDAFQPLLLLDPRKTKEIINEGFDEAQMAAIVVDSELIGALGRGFGKYLPIVAIVVVIAFVLLGLMFLPQILQGFG